MGLRLTIVEGNARGRTFAFELSSVSIGRGAANDLVLDDRGVSRSHATISRRGSALFLDDSESSNGTLLNGAILRRPARLRGGDEIRVGPVLLRVSLERSRDRRPGSSGVVHAWWRLPRSARAASAMAMAALAVAAALVVRVQRSDSHPACPETVAIDEEMADLTFGGPRADVACRGAVVFGFEVRPGMKAILRYRVERLTSGSLELRLNGRHFASVNAKAEADLEVESVSVPTDILSEDGRNFASFSQAGGDGDWSVGNVAVELVAAAAGDPIAALQAFERGKRKLEERRIAPRNLYDAWKAFADARRHLDGLQPRPPLDAEAARLLDHTSRELSRLCNRLLFVAGRFDRYDQAERAQLAWREVLQHFPGDDPTGCRKKAQDNIVPAQAEEAL